MPSESRMPRSIVLAALIIGTLASLIAARYRLHVEDSNRRVEIGLEWDEVSRLAQFTHRPVEDILKQFKKADVTTLVVQEDTFTTLEQEGQIHPVRFAAPGGRSTTHLDGLS